LHPTLVELFNVTKRFFTVTTKTRQKKENHRMKLIFPQD
jgi:hypothetical protein